jgi:putative acetyltransferase
MTKEIQIRRAEPVDAEAIAKVLHESFVEYEPLYTPGGFAATALNVQQVLVRMNEGPVWVAQRKGRILGTVAAIGKADSVYMRGMALLPAARGSGVGARLIDMVEQWCGEKGFSRIFLSTTPFLHSAIRLYEKHGFRRVEGEHDLFGTQLFVMEKIFLQNQSDKEASQTRE